MVTWNEGNGKEIRYAEEDLISFGRQAGVLEDGHAEVCAVLTLCRGDALKDDLGNAKGDVATELVALWASQSASWNEVKILEILFR